MYTINNDEPVTLFQKVLIGTYDNGYYLEDVYKEQPLQTYKSLFDLCLQRGLSYTYRWFLYRLEGIFSRYTLKDSQGKEISQAFVYNYIYDHTPETNARTYRQAPVARTGKRGGYHNYWRYPKTTQEVRECENPDLKEYGIKVRRNRRSLPMSWDDVYKQHHKNWKYYRKTQWK